MAESQQPDVILLDLMSPIPVVICSGLAPSGSQLALQALQEGAVEVVAKPKLGVSKFLHDSAVQLIDAVWAAAGARLRVRWQIGRCGVADEAIACGAADEVVSLPSVAAAIMRRSLQRGNV